MPRHSCAPVKNVSALRPQVLLLVFSNGTPKQIMQAGKMNACTRCLDVGAPMALFAKGNSCIPVYIQMMWISSRLRLRRRGRLAAVFGPRSELGVPMPWNDGFRSMELCTSLLVVRAAG